jgi:hypothetical protein
MILYPFSWWCTLFLPLRIKLVLTALLALAVISPARVEWWYYAGNFEQTPFPGRLSALPVVQSVDMDGNHLPEILRLVGGQAQLLENSQAVWQSPPDWRVGQAAYTDLDHDGQTELALLVWRQFKPWLIDRFLPYGGRIDSFHDSGGQSCHLILIGWKLDAYRELWAGSPLADPLQSFYAADLDGDGFQELAALEGRYDDPPGAPAWSLSVWDWNSFGFSLVERLQGPVTDFQPLLPSAGGTFLLVQRP